MPKRFGQTLCSFATIMMAFGFVGCRSTTSRLASVPGLGWLERGDEGWAQYEPAPGLPRPSSTSEPSALGGSKASNIASTRPPSTNSSLGGTLNKSDANAYAGGTGPRLDAHGFGSESSKASESTNNNAQFGDYASAYGKYGPPSSIPSNPNSSTAQSRALPQKGLYDAGTPKYATAGSGGSTSGYDALANKYEKQADANQPEPSGQPFGFASNDRFDNSAPPATSSSSQFGSDPAPSYTANSNSRFGANATTNSIAPKTSVYTPPGFVTSSTSGNASATSRFGGGSAPFTSNGAANDDVAAAVDEVKTATEPLVERSNELIASRNQPFGSAVTPQSRYGGPLPSSQPSATVAQNRFAEARDTLGQIVESADTQTKPAIGDYASGAASQLRDQAAEASRNIANSETFANAAETAKDYLNATADGLNQSREAIRGVASAAGTAGRNVMQNVSASLQNRYPSTSTPHGYVLPGGSVTNENRSSAPATASPATTRSQAPFRPGSTSSFEGANVARKPLVELASHSHPEPDELVLAVGDRYQFPVLLR